MNDDRYERTIDELEQHACKWWPREVRDEAQKISILQMLLDTQEKFISILKLANVNDTESIFKVLDASNFAYNLFLKHWGKAPPGVLAGRKQALICSPEGTYISSQLHLFGKP